MRQSRADMITGCTKELAVRWRSADELGETSRGKPMGSSEVLDKRETAMTSEPKATAEIVVKAK